MRSRRALGTVALLIAAGGMLVACTDDDPDGSEGPRSAESSSAAAESTAPTPTPAARPPRTPKVGACYRMAFDAALAPTSGARPRDCAEPHTAETYRVGSLDTLADGHLLAVDSDRAQQQVAEACPGRLSSYVGGDLTDLRLSMVRPVWFTPTVAASDKGANWFRCDAVVVTGSAGLFRTTGSLRGILDGARSDEVAMCGTAAPDAAAFDRVPCAARHSWRAISVVTFVARDYPGAAAARERGQGTCEDAAEALADDPLDFEWGYEWPTKAQWGNGMTFGRCWAPD
ncbi:hypothetical protein E8D34_14085 [Nocardioides sp. GY 10113]|uniref:septum formation family protein n=1 Tax=Nocardioides sp. GY 10113 TaxID=2569761 RepID=UPI0010A85D06|nr:septum formation family protein [Nocardioides sp. GY 10113]TIC84839.1 hypothetical protein E8D34_14085 [Nocardioides sp. GY 10113]